MFHIEVFTSKCCSNGSHTDPLGRLPKQRAWQLQPSVHGMLSKLITGMYSSACCYCYSVISLNATAGHSPAGRRPTTTGQTERKRRRGWCPSRRRRRRQPSPRRPSQDPRILRTTTRNGNVVHVPPYTAQRSHTTWTTTVSQTRRIDIHLYKSILTRNNKGQSESSETSLSGVEFSSNNRSLAFQCKTRSFCKIKLTSLCLPSAGSMAAWADAVAFETSSKTKLRRKNYAKDEDKCSATHK